MEQTPLNSQSTTPISPIPPPIGKDLSLETMRALAVKYGALSFTEQQLVDDSDYGYMLNKQDSTVQFGVSEYRSSQEGFNVTHSIATFFPAELKALTGMNTAPAGVYYNDVIDITVPYLLPHMVISPKLSGPITAFISGLVMQPKPAGLTSVRLEGDFSEFVQTTVLKGEDVTAFTYLAPDVMEKALLVSKTITVEWIGNHIYLYYRQPEAVGISGEFNTHLNGTLHEKMLQAGLEIADKLGKNARPARVLEPPVKQMPRQTTGSLIGIFTTFLGLPILFFITLSSFSTGSPLGIVGLIIIAIISIRPFVKMAQSKKLMKKYEQRYGKYAKNVETTPQKVV